MDDCYLILYIYPWYYLKSQLPYQPGRVSFVPVRKCWLQVQVYIHQTNTGINNNTAFSPNSSIAFWCIIITTSLQILGGALDNQHPFQHCNPCPLMSMKVTQKICTIEFPKLEIGVQLAYHITTFVFCDSGCLSLPIE
jgi:hypothetical protein